MKMESKIKMIIFSAFFIFVLFSSFSLSIALDSAYGPEIKKENYIISRSKVERVINQGDIFTDRIVIFNLVEQDLKISFSTDAEISDTIEFEVLGITVMAKNNSEVSFFIKGKEIKNYSGYIRFIGSSNELLEALPVNISVVEDSLSAMIFIGVELLKKKFNLNDFLEFKLNINEIESAEIKNISFSYSILDEQNNTYFLGSEVQDISGSFQAMKKFKFPKDLKEGFYVLETTLTNGNKVIMNKTPFSLKRPFFKILIFGFFPMWLLILVLILAVIGFIGYYLTKKRAEKRKKYRMKLDVKTLPKEDPNFLFLGKIAETNISAYLEPDKLTTHTIVAGATGGGKSISAQVLVEEALLKNIAVIVFDPTAQWSGMLRKCDDKKMLAYYPKFGLKESDAKAFKGNVRQVKNARELIDLNKYASPGQIQIFTLNKLDPNGIDIFVANVIRQIFISNFPESSNLRVLVVFDEVHRLLSRFGGSGEGFLQVERACREFRKWGIGVMLISQVLSDFVGEIKANISSEMQMRTRDEGDLERIKVKYGEEFLQSLVKASVGVGMFVNPSYNLGRPYFINFRPILHNTRRLSDEELEKYNKYNEITDDIEYQIEQLEKEKIDPFDLKMELKLVKDKVMTGNFSVVEIYLEGLTPRIEKEWQKLGKKPKKREVQLVEESEIKKSVEEAKKEREKWEKLEAAKEVEKKETKEENIEEKIVNPLVFDNGIMVSSLKELKSVLPGLDNDIFEIHVNKNKNDIAKWLVTILPAFDKLKSITDKESLIKELENFGKTEKNEKEEAKPAETESTEAAAEAKPAETESKEVTEETHGETESTEAAAEAKPVETESKEKKEEKTGEKVSKEKKEGSERKGKKAKPEEKRNIKRKKEVKKEQKSKK